MSDADLLADLRAAEIANGTVDQCDACDVRSKVSDAARSAVSSALSGTIGAVKLARILTDQGYPIGRRAIDRHRREAHE